MKRITIMLTGIYCKSRQILCWVSQVFVWKMAVRPLPLQACIGFGGTVGTGLILHPDHKTLIYPLGTTIVLRDRVWTQPLLLLTTSICKYQGNSSPLRLKSPWPPCKWLRVAWCFLLPMDFNLFTTWIIRSINHSKWWKGF
jgi:hypothetical protein